MYSILFVRRVPWAGSFPHGSLTHATLVILQGLERAAALHGARLCPQLRCQHIEVRLAPDVVRVARLWPRTQEPVACATRIAPGVGACSLGVLVPGEGERTAEQLPALQPGVGSLFDYDFNTPNYKVLGIE